MGEHKLKKETPAVRRGPHGKHYYCRNGCGRVVGTLYGKEHFVERAGIRHYGWCMHCIAADQQPVSQRKETT